MEEKTKWTHVTYVMGIIAQLVGILDPLEGSILVAAGSILVVLSTFVTHDRHRKLFLLSCIMIITGVAFMFYLSSLGGFGDKSILSWWWGILILPYPIGWLITMITLIVRAFEKAKK